MVGSLNEVFEQYGENNKHLVVLGISLIPDDDQEKIEQFKKDNNGKYPDIEGKKYGAKIFSEYKSILGDGYPNLCLINPENEEIVWHEKGFKSYPELETILTNHGVEKNPTNISVPSFKNLQNQFSILYIHENQLVFSIFDQAPYTLALFSIQGNQLASLTYANPKPGLQTVNLDRWPVANGTYIVQVKNDFYNVSKRINVLK